MNTSLIEKNIAGFLATAIVMMTCMIPGPRAHAGLPTGEEIKAEIEALKKLFEKDLEILKEAGGTARSHGEYTSNLVKSTVADNPTLNAPAEISALEDTAKKLKDMATAIDKRVGKGNEAIEQVKKTLMEVTNWEVKNKAIENAEKEAIRLLNELNKARLLPDGSPEEKRYKFNELIRIAELRVEAERALQGAKDAAKDQLKVVRDEAKKVRDLPQTWRDIVNTIRGTINTIQLALTRQLKALLDAKNAFFARQNTTMAARMLLQMKEMSARTAAQAAEQTRRALLIARTQARILADMTRIYREQISAAIAAGYTWLKGTGVALIPKSVARIAAGSAQLAGAIVAGLAIGCESLYGDYAKATVNIEIECGAERICAGMTRTAQMAGMPAPKCDGRTLAEITADLLAKKRDGEAAINSFNLACASTGLVDKLEMATLRCD